MFAWHHEKVREIDRRARINAVMVMFVSALIEELLGAVEPVLGMTSGPR